MKHTQTGDTITVRSAHRKKHTDKSSASDLDGTVLQGVPSPPAVFSVAVESESPSHQKDLDVALAKLLAEDPSLQLSTDVHSGETLLSGMGQLHLEIVVDHLSRTLPHTIHVSEPRVTYRETITSSAVCEEHYDNVIGSTRLRASLKLMLEPIIPEAAESGNASWKGTSDLDDNQIILPGDFSENIELASHIQKSIMAALRRGPLLGSPTSHIRAIVTSSSDEINASSSAAISACANSAVSKALTAAQPRLLEPVMRVECCVPESCMGDVIGDLTHPSLRRGIVDSVERKDAADVDIPDPLVRIHANVPLEGMIGWSTKIRSATKGRGDFSMEFASYEILTSSQQASIIAKLRG
jgi:elongation factor G